MRENESCLEKERGLIQGALPVWHIILLQSKSVFPLYGILIVAAFIILVGTINYSSHLYCTYLISEKRLLWFHKS